MTSQDSKLSPMMAQWNACKEEAQNALLLFRLGDFYEAFYDDAVTCAKELDLTLTKRQQVPMSGIPSYTVESYIDKLVAKGYRVAIADQVEDAKFAKGLVKREITRIVTPATIVNSTFVSEKSNNYFAALTQVGQQIGLAFLDLTCADCKVIELTSIEDVQAELYRFKPSEILTSSKFCERHPALFLELKRGLPTLVDTIEEWRFDHQLTYGFLTQTFRVHSLDGFGLKGMVAAINAAGALLAHVSETLYQSLTPLQKITPYKAEAFMGLDRATLRHLELVEPLQPDRKKNTLLEVIDKTLTPMGGRLIKRWLLQPLLALNPIIQRQEAIEEFLMNAKLLENARKELSSIRDLERLITRMTTIQASPRDLVALKCALEPIHPLKTLLKGCRASLIIEELKKLHDFQSLIELLQKALVDEPFLRISDGGSFRKGYHEELDELRELAEDSKSWMNQYQMKIREGTGIKALKVGYSKVGGFFIEVSKGQAEKMPSSFERRQTLTNAERFTTPELKGYEEKILNAEERMYEIELSLFQELKQKALSFSREILETAGAIGVIDTLASLAFASKLHNFTRPTIDEGKQLHIVEGRHPIIESAFLSEKFIPNDTHLDWEEERLKLITGPNMAGKSTYLRQVALIVILAQMGSFVPATRAVIGLVDKVFSRIGASDDLARGQSTFMVEMSETANILHNATSRSLVILDEIGRGTSTYDGISLAWSIAEYLLTHPDHSPKTLFATHYWELTKLEEKVSGAVNYNVAVHENGDQILFLRKIIRGGTDKSYGIHVAKLAGIPPVVLERAKEILQHLEENANRKNAFEAPRQKKGSPPKNKPSSKESQLFLI